MQFVANIGIGFRAVGVGIFGQRHDVTLPWFERRGFGERDDLFLCGDEHVGDPWIVGVAETFRVVITQATVAHGVIDVVEVVPQRPADPQSAPNLATGAPGLAGNPRNGLHAVVAVGHPAPVQFGQDMCVGGLSKTDQCRQLHRRIEQCLVMTCTHIEARELPPDFVEFGAIDHANNTRRGV